MCSECVGGINKKEIFFKKSLHLCESCDLWPIYMPILIILLLFLICLIIIMIERRAQQAQVPPSIGKILSTHLQYVFQATLQGSSLPSPVKSLTSNLSIALSSEGLFNILSCMQLYIPVSLYLLRLLITLFSIAILFVGLFGIWNLIAFFKKMPRKVFKIKLVTSVVVITYFLHSNYVNIFLRNLSCKEYENNQYLSSNLGQKCWDKEHMFFSSIITLPMVIIWMVLLPAIVYKLVVHNKKKKIESFSHVVRYFVNGFKEEYYYWEFVILLEKYIFILIPLIFKNVANLPILILYTLLLLTYLIIHAEVQPYSLKVINNLQFLSYYASFISYFISIINSLSDNEQVLIFISILYYVLNGGFYLFWISMYYKLVIKTKLLKIKAKYKNMLNSPNQSRSKR